MNQPLDYEAEQQKALVKEAYNEATTKDKLVYNLQKNTGKLAFFAFIIGVLVDKFLVEILAKFL
jgi:hypothetical protein